MRFRWPVCAWMLFGAVAVVATSHAADRPRDPWVFRSVLDGRARMLTVALNEKLYIAYDTQTCTLRRAWHDGVKFSGGVYDARHGPQPTSVGKPYYSTKDDDGAWSLTLDGKVTDVKPHYVGYRLEKDVLSIEYAFEWPGGRVTVTELPSCRIDGASVTLIRTLRVKGLKAGATLTLSRAGNSDDPLPTWYGMDIDVKPSPVEVDQPPGQIPDRPPAVRFVHNGGAGLLTTWSLQ